MEMQSPINVVPTVRATSRLPLKLHWCGTNGFLRHGEHGTQVLFEQPNDNTATLDGKSYVLRQFHFHHPSEHFLEGTQFDGELHLVHQDLDDCTFFVLAIFLSIAEQDAVTPSNTFFEAVLKKKCIDVPTNPNDFIPEGADTTYRYQGSLTTPPYSETVSWVVLRDPFSISEQLFGEIFGTENSTEGKLQKARPLQPVNGRYIIEHKVKWSST